MSAEVSAAPDPGGWPHYASILVALDASDHSNRAVAEAVALAGPWGGRVTGAHVYAARLHDLRFRQMEGGLPERFRREEALEHQREVHDDLITRGLGVITDSYLDDAQRACADAGVPFARRSLEGKNYRELVREANGGGHDLLVLGALGLGAIDGSRIGSVCLRTVRRAAIDVLVVKEPGRSIARGPVVAAVDGSSRAWGALQTALALGARWRVPVHVVAAFDPHFHYVAFHRIARVLSEEASKVFRFREQERLHEEIIDAGLARIYEGHLSVARAIAAERGIEVRTELLAGKPHDAVARHVREAGASLLAVGRLGVHADDDLDVGGTTEALLREVDCAVLVGERRHVPAIDAVAETTMAWTDEALRRMERVPSFARGIARTAILRFAQERGHTVITERLVEQATAALCPGHARQAQGAQGGTDAANGLDATGGLGAAADRDGDRHGRRAGAPAASPRWTAAAEARLARVPAGFVRELVRRRVDARASSRGLDEVTPALIDEKYAEWGAGSARRTGELPWDEDARRRIDRIPEFVRGMVALEVERCAREMGAERVTAEALDRAIAAWARTGTFHSDRHAGLYTATAGDSVGAGTRAQAEAGAGAGAEGGARRPAAAKTGAAAAASTGAGEDTGEVTERAP